jgi:hypothetical protein
MMVVLCMPTLLLMYTMVLNYIQSNGITLFNFVMYAKLHLTTGPREKNIDLKGPMTAPYLPFHHWQPAESPSQSLTFGAPGL